MFVFLLFCFSHFIREDPTTAIAVEALVTMSATTMVVVGGGE